MGYAPGHFPQSRQHCRIQAAAALAVLGSSQGGSEAASASRSRLITRLMRDRQRRFAPGESFKLAIIAATAMRGASSTVDEKDFPLGRVTHGAVSTGAASHNDRTSNSTSLNPIDAPHPSNEAGSSSVRAPQGRNYAVYEDSRNANTRTAVMRAHAADLRPSLVLTAKPFKCVDKSRPARGTDSLGQRPDHQGQRDPVGVRRRHMAAVARHHITARTA